MSTNDTDTDTVSDGDNEPVPEPQTFTEAEAHELVTTALAEHEHQRRWLRSITPLLQLRSHESDPSGRVQLAFDLMHIAACERAARILNSDLERQS